MVRAMAPLGRGHKGRVSLERRVSPAYHTAMDDRITPLRPLDPAFLRVLRWKGAIVAFVLLVAALGVETVFYNTDLPNGIVPKLSETPGGVRWQGPALGAHTDSVLAELGFDEAGIAALREKGAVA